MSTPRGCVLGFGVRGVWIRVVRSAVRYPPRLSDAVEVVEAPRVAHITSTSAS
jgi:hypothetical protein